MTKNKAIAKTNKKDLSSSAIVTIAFVIATIVSTAIAETCNAYYLRSDEACSASYFFNTISIFLWVVYPVALFMIWVLGHRKYNEIQENYGKGPLRLFFSVALAIYLIYANKYAGDLVNELFKVDSGHFGVSVAAISIFFAPLGFYRSDLSRYVADFIGSILPWLYAFALAVSILTVIYRKKVSNKTAMISFGITLFSVWAYFAVFFIQNIDQSLKNFVVWADFNESHKCNDVWLQRGKSVVFLDGSNVLALIEPAIFAPLGKMQFLLAGPCTYTSRKEAESFFEKR